MSEKTKKNNLIIWYAKRAQLCGNKKQAQQANACHGPWAMAMAYGNCKWAIGLLSGYGLWLELPISPTKVG